MVLTIREHQYFGDEDANVIRSLELNLSNTENKVKYLGLKPDLSVSYFIGAEWLKENEYALHVKPKMRKIDYISMFMHCLNDNKAFQEGKKIYNIFLDKPPIKLETGDFEITPFLVIHFLTVIKSIIKKGLKLDYNYINKNLHAKVKGKINFSNHYKANLINKRYDRNYCSYQEYSVDCLENRILKKTLVFIQTYIQKKCNKPEIINLFNYCFAAFDNVSDDIDARKVRDIRVNPIFKEYAEASRLAKLILRHFGYSLSGVTNLSAKHTPPFWVDMSLLFELYTYSKLQILFKNSLLFQPQGHYGKPDFLLKEEQIIIDAKYKEYYRTLFSELNEGHRASIASDIRQVSGYARDKRLLSKIGLTPDNVSYLKTVKCLIVYPNQKTNEFFQELEPIKEFVEVYKTGIKLPEL